MSNAHIARAQSYGASGTGFSVMFGAGGSDLVRGFRHSVVELGIGFSFY